MTGYLGGNVIKIEPISAFTLNQNKPEEGKSDDDASSLELNAETLEMLEGLDLDEEIEDGIKMDDLRRGVGYDREQQRLHLVRS